MIRAREDLAWAGGLFEGEGCFSIMTWHRKRFRCSASLMMTDRDVMQRFVDVIGLGRLLGPYEHSRGGGRYLPHWKWQISGFEEVQALFAMLWPWLGKRRRTRAVEVLAATPLVKRRRRPVPWGRQALN